MATKHLLDTNIVIASLGEEAAVQSKLARTAAVWINVVVLGELLFGAENSGRPEANRLLVFNFTITCGILPCDESTARFYALVKARQKKQGRPIPENDLWIAASALQHDLTLVTRDTHFASVPGLKVETW